MAQPYPDRYISARGGQYRERRGSATRSVPRERMAVRGYGAWTGPLSEPLSESVGWYLVSCLRHTLAQYGTASTTLHYLSSTQQVPLCAIAVPHTSVP
eukprot:3807406-Rhodomonas_salina.1